MTQKWLRNITNISWVLLIGLLPITSLPILSRAMGGTSVAPLSAIFLLILVLVWFLPGFFRNQILPVQALPLLVFVIIALVSSLLSVFLPIPSFRDISPLDNAISSWVTLAVGLFFYLVSLFYLDSEQKFHQFIRIVNYSGAVILVYSLVQAFFWYTTNTYPEWLRNIQGSISTSGMLFRARVTGFALEPSWLAHQINLLYLPLWIGLSLKKYSAHRRLIWKISFENILLIFGLLVLFLSLSRIGWLATLAIIAYLFMRLMNHLSQSFTDKVFSKRKSKILKWQSVAIKVGFWFVFLLIMLSSVIVAGVLFTKLDTRMRDLFNITQLQRFGVLGWASKLIFAERLIYWMAGFRVFQLFPWLGVGLGSSGYFYQETFDSFGYQLTEIVGVLIRENFIPNAKNLWVRLLSETGIIGFSFFITWIYLHWYCARKLERQATALISSFGWFGELFLIAFVLEGFSLDSFGLPYYWISMGVILAAYRLSRAAEVRIQSFD